MNELPGYSRDDFPILSKNFGKKPLRYLDSAATSQKPVQVTDAVASYYHNANANVHRGSYALADQATTAYEEARKRVAAFLNASSANDIAFTRGTTSGINLVAYGWGLNRLSEKDRIVLTILEHHSNIVPWQIISRHTGAELVYLPIDHNYRIDLSAIEHAIDERVKIVAISGMSNVTGTILPVTELAAAAHAVGAIVVVDGAQLVPHLPTDVQSLGADLLSFSGHKMLGPTGIGVVWGKPEILEEMEPAEGGGEMISDVQLHESRWAPIPHKFEAGTPPIAQAVGLGAAIEYLEKISMTAVRDHGIAITKYALKQLETVPDLKIHGPSNLEERGAVVSLELADIHAHDLATILDQFGVAVRAGHHCAKPLMRHLQVPATARASFYLYTTTEDIDALVDALFKARKVFRLK